MHSVIPSLGVGLGWRREVAGAIAARPPCVAWCEIIADNFIHATPEQQDPLRNLAGTLPVVPHAVDLSIGTDAPLDEAYLAGLATLVARVDAPWFSDHLCFTQAAGYRLGQLTPLPFSEGAVEVVVRKAKQIKTRISRPFLLENIAYGFRIPYGEMSEAEFITRVLERADTGLLLDLCNVYINAINHRYDPYRFLRSLPLGRVVQIHIAGGELHQGRWIDSHSQAVPDEVFELTEFVLARAPVKGILLERDTNFPASFSALEAELNRAQTLFKKYQGGSRRPSGPARPPAMLTGEPTGFSPTPEA